MKITVCLMLLVLTACHHNEGTKVEALQLNEQDDFEIVKLFTLEGCTIYRFHDKEYPRYFTTCEGSVSSIPTEACGKSACPFPDAIETRRKHK